MLAIVKSISTALLPTSKQVVFLCIQLIDPTASDAFKQSSIYKRIINNAGGAFHMNEIHFEKIYITEIELLTLQKIEIKLCSELQAEQEKEDIESICIIPINERQNLLDTNKGLLIQFEKVYSHSIRTSRRNKSLLFVSLGNKVVVISKAYFLSYTYLGEHDLNLLNERCGTYLFATCYQQGEEINSGIICYEDNRLIKSFILRLSYNNINHYNELNCSEENDEYSDTWVDLGGRQMNYEDEF